jgi:hypothetical protein
MLMLIVSVTHLVLMAWVYPIVRRLYQQEYELWFKGHMQNFGWAALFAVVPLWHRW